MRSASVCTQCLPNSYAWYGAWTAHVLVMPEIAEDLALTLVWIQIHADTYSDLYLYWWRELSRVIGTEVLAFRGPGLVGLV